MEKFNFTRPWILGLDIRAIIGVTLRNWGSCRNLQMHICLSSFHDMIKISRSLYQFRFFLSPMFIFDSWGCRRKLLASFGSWFEKVEAHRSFPQCESRGLTSISNRTHRVRLFIKCSEMRLSCSYLRNVPTYGIWIISYQNFPVWLTHMLPI